MNKTEQIAIMGSTGSIGQSTLAVIDQNPDRYSVFALCANTNVDRLFEQACRYQPKYLAMADAPSAQRLRERIESAGLVIEVMSGAKSLSSLAAHDEVDTLVAAIVGAAGLSSTMAAVDAGKKILLANKETLVCSGGLFMEAVAKSGATLLPVDSEHNAIFQCLPSGKLVDGAGVSKIYLTGSGGPFRGKQFSQLQDITPEEACAHPNWSMGKKISVDSATMMNKGLELIEACWLFDITPNEIDLVIHPQSIVHSMVEYIDGSVLAHLGSPDMKTPIAHALAWPDRIESGAEPFNIFDASLSFEPPDLGNYPCLELAIQAANDMGAIPLVLNSANEIAVAAFLEKKMFYTDIPKVVQEMLSISNFSEPRSIDEVIEQDQNVRALTTELIEKMAV